jgi:hypothetical protein
MRIISAIIDSQLAGFQREDLLTTLAKIDTIPEKSLDVIELVDKAFGLTASGRNDLAIDIYQEWLKGSDSALRYAVAYNLAVALGAEGGKIEAVKVFRLALAHKFDFPLAHFGLALELGLLWETDKARDHWDWILNPVNDVEKVNSDIKKYAAIHFNEFTVTG